VKLTTINMAVPNPTTDMPYDTVAESRNVFSALLSDPKLSLSPAIASQASNVHIHGLGSSQPTIPTPWRETEAITAVKALEACIALAIAELRFPSASNSDAVAPTASIDADHATVSLFMSYLSTVNGFGKWDSRSMPFLKPTDIHQAQSNLYRRLSANIYETRREGEYYHTHGSLDATPILDALGLPGFLQDSQDEGVRRLEGDYEGICRLIQERTRRFVVEELDEMTVRLRQAGAVVYKEEEFLRTEQGRAMKGEPVVRVERVEGGTEPAGFAVDAERNGSGGEQSKSKPWVLKGVKVLDLTRVIAGPSISRTLAEYGASVLKVTSPKLPDVPWYAVDLNFGKRACELDLTDQKDRVIFERLLDEDGGVDVVVDGYRPGSLDRLGYGVDTLKKRWGRRGKGFVYVRESCFGHVGPWKDRSGWQPIADAVSGLAWGHGIAMGLDQPVLPPFPMSDYGTGALGAVGALLAIYKRAVEGGSYVADVSLTGWNLWVQSLGQYPPDLWESMLEQHKPEIEEFKIGHLSNFDVVSKASIKSMRRLTPRLFDDKHMFEMDAPGFKGPVKSMRPVVRYSGIRTGFEAVPGRETRPNGSDAPKWN
jgi:hypothetical protein